MDDAAETFLVGRREPPLRALVGRAMFGPAEDDAEPAEPARELATDLEGLAIGIVYVSAGGARSERAIRCLRLTEHGGVYYIQAWCKMREAYRSFRLDRIAEVIDYSTGEVIDDVAGFFEPYLDSLAPGPQPLAWHPPPVHVRRQPHRRPASPAAAIRCFRDGARVLLFISMADGALHPAESAIITGYAVGRIRKRAPLTAEPEAVAGRWIRNQAPTRRVAMAALRAVLEDAEHGRDLAHAMVDLIAADGIVTDDEMATAWDLVKAMDRHERRHAAPGGAC